jgi:3-hydroxybutyryl-CoA dehydrogenase
LATTDATVDVVRQYGEALGKQLVFANDAPGFIVNRVLMPMINEAFYAWMEGVAEPEAIDGIMKLGCNFPMGPFALLDLVGLDTSLSILDALYNEFRDPNYAAMPTLRRMVAAGQLGRKSKAGFYSY